MKKIILASILVVASSIVIGLSSEMVAAESKPVTYITGQVAPPEYDPYSVAGFEVRASCRDPFTHESYGSGRDITDADGGFLIVLPREQCPEDSRVWASAEDYTAALWSCQQFLYQGNQFQAYHSPEFYKPALVIGYL